MKKILFSTLAFLLLTGCTESNDSGSLTETTSGESKNKYESLTIKTNVVNTEARDDKYLVFLLPPGVKETEPGKATQGGYYGPFETSQDGEVEIDLSYNENLNYYLDSQETDNPKIEVIVTTTEDIYLRNPLNEATFIEFKKNDTDEPFPEIVYYSTVEKETIDIVDRYPNGVVSLTFPDATFVIKLEFEEGYEPKSSYEVSIAKASGTTVDGIGIERNGRIAREFQYWDTPFFESDKLSVWDGVIVVHDFDTNERLSYEGFPKTVTFDSNGKCEQGDIVKIKLVK